MRHELDSKCILYHRTHGEEKEQKNSHIYHLQ